jgi:hypothetical protein
MWISKKRLNKIEEAIQEICPHKFNSNSFKQHYSGWGRFYKVCNICGKEFIYINHSVWDIEKKQYQIQETEETLRRLKGEKSGE